MYKWYTKWIVLSHCFIQLKSNIEVYIPYIIFLLKSMVCLKVGRGSNSHWTLCTPPRSDMV
jgi:hypothetical protein